MIRSFIVLVLLFISATCCCAEDRIILRNLKMISDRTVKSFDIDGVVLDDGKLLTWDRIEKAKLESVDQEKFDEFLGRLSDPLFRIRLRLVNGDDAQALSIAEQMFPIYQSSRGELGTLVCAALVRGRIASGQREQSVVALLHYLTRVSDGGAAKLPQSLRLPIDSQTYLCRTLMPVWFDKQQAKEQLPFLLESLKTAGKFPTEFHLYTGSLAIAAGDMESAKKAIDALKDSDTIHSQFRTLLQSQLLIEAGRHVDAKAQLKDLIASDTPQIRVIALYWTGVAELKGDRLQQMRGALTLLRIVASYGDQFQELAAAALYHASNVFDSGDDQQKKSLRRELSRRFPDTWHGKLLDRMSSTSQ